jgi:glycosyltransferase involved in cell wall biosynthesis
VRSVRPACRSWALRIDQEFGTLPHELTPHVTQDADAVVVHSEHVYRTVTAAGRPMASVRVVPHGVDAAMHEQAQPDAELLAWKGDLPAVLFCGGMIWRKGFDLFLRAVLQAHQAGARFCVVVKSIGHDQHYGRFHLGNLVERFLRTPGTPPLRVVDAELTRDQLASLYTACDVLLHPYRGEGFCLPVLEARACGLPVLATAGGATDPLLVGPGATPLPSCRREVELPTAHVGTPGVLEPSSEAIAAALASKLAELPARQAAARGFASSVRAAYTWDAAAAALETLAFTAMGRRRVVPAPVAIEPVVTVPQPEPLLPAVRAAIGVVR